MRPLDGHPSLSDYQDPFDEENIPDGESCACIGEKHNSGCDRATEVPCGCTRNLHGAWCPNWDAQTWVSYGLG